MDVPFQQSISEADIDWIVCGELNASPEFRSWFSRKIFDSDLSSLHQGAWRSIVAEEGESDLVWLVERPEGKVLVLIENKINAPAQPQQEERYRLRGERYVSDRIAERFVTALMAPERYASADSQKYERKVTYEEIAAYFSEQETERSKFLHSLFQAALRKKYLTQVAPSDAEVTLFRRRIWELADREFPELEWLEPGAVSNSQYWVEVCYGGFWIKYKMYRKGGTYGDCVVDLELPAIASRVDDIHGFFGAEVAELGGMIVVRGKSVALSVNVPRITPPQYDEIAVREALQACRKLLLWWKTNRTRVGSVLSSKLSRCEDNRGAAK